MNSCVAKGDCGKTRTSKITAVCVAIDKLSPFFPFAAPLLGNFSFFCTTDKDGFREVHGIKVAMTYPVTSKQMCQG